MLGVDDINGHILIPTGAPVTRTGKSNLACNFDFSDDSLAMTDHADISPTTGMALSTWVYFDNTTAHHGLFRKLPTECDIELSTLLNNLA